jgi:hypothetical protein
MIGGERVADAGQVIGDRVSEHGFLLGYQLDLVIPGM